MRLWDRIWSSLKEPRMYWRLFSLALAIVLWLLAAGEGTIGSSERIISLPVQIKNLPADQALFEQPEAVRVRVRGLAPLLNMVENDLNATIDLGAAVEGEGTFGVQVQAPTGVEIVSITPRWVRIRTEQIVRKDFPVTLGLLGVYPQEIIHSVKPEPETVQVRAPHSIMDQITQVVAYITLGEGITRLEGAFPLRAIDELGHSIEPVTLDPQEVRVVLEQADSADEQTRGEPNG